MIGGVDTSGWLFGASWYASAWRVERYFCLLSPPLADREYLEQVLDLAGDLYRTSWPVGGTDVLNTADCDIHLS